MDIVMIIVALGILVVFMILGFVVIGKKQTPAKIQYDVAEILRIFEKNNINSVDFVRNKIVIDFVNIDFFNPEDLKECGAKGISIVGDKIKFFVDGTPEQNNELFQQIKKHLEG